MAVDKRFWSGAIIVVTVAIAGAGALPALLLQPAGPDAGSVEAVAPQRAEAKPVDVQPVDPKPLAQSPAPIQELLVAPVRVEPARLAQPAPEPVLQAPEPAMLPVPAGEAGREAAKPPLFPPVQPVGLSTRTETELAPSPVPAQSNRVEPKAANGARARAVAQPHTPQRRFVRPARYPIREFLAWRR